MRAYYWTGSRPAVRSGSPADIGPIGRSFVALRDWLAQRVPDIQGLTMSEVPAGFQELPPGVLFREHPNITMAWPTGHPLEGKARFKFTPITRIEGLFQGEMVVYREGDGA